MLYTEPGAILHRRKVGAFGWVGISAYDDAPNREPKPMLRAVYKSKKLKTAARPTPGSAEEAKAVAMLAEYVIEACREQGADETAPAAAKPSQPVGHISALMVPQLLGRSPEVAEAARVAAEKPSALHVISSSAGGGVGATIGLGRGLDPGIGIGTGTYTGIRAGVGGADYHAQVKAKDAEIAVLLKQIKQLQLMPQPTGPMAAERTRTMRASQSQVRARQVQHKQDSDELAFSFVRIKRRESLVVGRGLRAQATGLAIK